MWDCELSKQNIVVLCISTIYKDRYISLLEWKSFKCSNKLSPKPPASASLCTHLFLYITYVCIWWYNIYYVYYAHFVFKVQPFFLRMSRPSNNNAHMFILQKYGDYYKKLLTLLNTVFRHNNHLFHIKSVTRFAHQRFRFTWYMKYICVCLYVCILV